MLSQISNGLGLFLQIAQVATILFAVYKFTRKPHDTLSDKYEDLCKRVDKIELLLAEIKKSLDASHEKHRQQDKTNATFKTVMLAFVDFEIAYCLHTNYEFTDDLVRAKKELQDYLARGNGENKET